MYLKRTVAIIAGCALLLAGCDSGQGTAPTSSGCQSLTAADIQRVAAGVTVKRTDLAPPASLHLTCSTVFAGPSGELVVAITEAAGGAATLAQVEQGKKADPNKPTIETVSGLGDEAFLVNSRYLAFRSGDLVVTLETSLAPGGSPVLTADQLRTLARIVLSAHSG